MNTGPGLGFFVALWMVAVALTIGFRILQGQREVGLVWAYIASLWLLHWPAALMYMLPWYRQPDYSTVYAGFVESTWGIIGFGLGAALFAPMMVKLFDPPGTGAHHIPTPPNALLPRSYLIIGAITYLVIVPVASRLPTVTSLATAAAQLVLVAICLRCWHGWFTKNSWMFYSSLAIAALMPVITILGQGFLGYGAAAVMTVLCFNGSFIKPRWKVGLAAVIIAYLGFSAFVTYMRDRGEIRRVVWGGESLTNRFTSVFSSVREAEFFDPRNQQHLQRIDMRLNQNFLVGASVETLTSGTREFARGETLKDAAIALIPRALWPEKPVYAGSPGVVAEYTGFTFAAGTSVGIGQVMEFYINFGTIGVIIGFIVLGTLVGMFDAWAAQRIWIGDWEQFGLWFLAGLGFIQAGGSLVEVASTVAAGMLTAALINRNVVPWLQGSAAHKHGWVSPPQDRRV